MVSSRKRPEADRLFKRRRPFFFAPPCRGCKLLSKPLRPPKPLCEGPIPSVLEAKAVFLFSKAWGFFILLKDIAKNGRAQPCALPFFSQVMAWQS
ncbi:hypothetical protein DWW99_12930 [[Clostridium] leptum]|nr:hypothetical protein DWW99_12930 [[Clostridium] leptum]